MEEMTPEERARLVERLGITHTHWRYLPNRSVNSFLQTTLVEPENICFGIEILGTEYKDKKNLKLLKESRAKEAIDGIIDFYKQNKGEYDVKIKRYGRSDYTY